MSSAPNINRRTSAAFEFLHFNLKGGNSRAVPKSMLKTFLSTPILALPPAFAEAASRRQASKGENLIEKLQISLIGF